MLEIKLKGDSTMTNLSRNINPTQADISQWVELTETNEWEDHYIAHRYNILTTPFVGYAVYEPMRNHSSMTTHEGKWLGDVTTRRLPDELEALKPYSKERSDAVTTYFECVKKFAERIVKDTWPEDFQEGEN
jgi:hypothetical protein